MTEALRLATGPMIEHLILLQGDIVAWLDQVRAVPNLGRRVLWELAEAKG
jgi:hypothetical protein